MKITLFTSNQPRHISLANQFSKIAEKVYVVQECNTVFPGKVSDFFLKSDVMQQYFSRVISAEEKIFGSIKFSENNISTMSIKSGDLSNISLQTLSSALESDIYIVFGSSYIKGPLIDLLVKKKAINIHMGLSPYYRGSSCNFWALYDGNPDLVGATIHLLSKGLDSGEILFHVRPKQEESESFELGMKAVQSAHNALVDIISSEEVFTLSSTPQDKTKEIRYTRNADFTDKVAEEYLSRELQCAFTKKRHNLSKYPLIFKKNLCDKKTIGT